MQRRDTSCIIWLIQPTMPFILSYNVILYLQKLLQHKDPKLTIDRKKTKFLIFYTKAERIVGSTWKFFLDSKDIDVWNIFKNQPSISILMSFRIVWILKNSFRFIFFIKQYIQIKIDTSCIRLLIQSTILFILSYNLILYLQKWPRY